MTLTPLTVNTVFGWKDLPPADTTTLPPSTTAKKPAGSTGFAVPCLVGSLSTVAGMPARSAVHWKVRAESLPPFAVGESPHRLHPGGSSLLSLHSPSIPVRSVPSFATDVNPVISRVPWPARTGARSVLTSDRAHALHVHALREQGRGRGEGDRWRVQRQESANKLHGKIVPLACKVDGQSDVDWLGA